MTETPKPFESAGELREQHAQLLALLDAALASTGGDDEQAVRQAEPAISRFLERAAATGAFLEDIKERTACQALADYWVSELGRAGMQAPRARLAAFDSARLPDLRDKPCPYVGLEAFRGSDHALFFGREADVAALVARLADTPLLVVLGASGSGKSSLVMGGLLPALAAGDAPPRLRIAPVVVPGDGVLLRLAKAVLAAVGASQAPAELLAALRQQPGALAALAQDGRPLLLTVDQFEEVFTLCSVDERELAAAALAALLAAPAGHRVVLTMREEFRSRLVELQALAPWLDRAWTSMRPMGYAELRAAVEQPAARVNLQFQPGIVDELVKKVLGQPAALPLLQFTLRQLWHARDRNRITREVVRKVGDPLVALQGSADSFFDSLVPQSQAEAKRILLALVRVDDLLEAYRQPVRKNLLLQAGKANTEEVLALLEGQDWVRTTDAEGADGIVEVKHEALIRNWPRLVGWIDEKRIERRQRLAITQAAQRWAAAGRPREGLLTGWQLEDAQRQSDLAELEQAFVEASAADLLRAQLDREAVLRAEAEQARTAARRERRMLMAALVALLVVGAFFATSLWSEQAATRKLAAADQRRTELQQQQAALTEEAQGLKVERDSLRSRNRQLQAEYDQLFANQVRATLARSGSVGRATINIQVSADSQRARAAEIRAQLVKNGIQVAEGIERVPTSPRETTLRYFHAEDADGARVIESLLGQYLRVNHLKSEQVRGYESRVSRGRYEIWFGTDALSSEAAGADTCPDAGDLVQRREGPHANVPRSFRLDAADIETLTLPAAQGGSTPLLPAQRAMLAALVGLDLPTEALFRAALRATACSTAKAQQTAARTAGKEVPPLSRLYDQLLPAPWRDAVVLGALRLHPAADAPGATWQAQQGCGCSPRRADAQVQVFAGYWAQGPEGPRAAGASDLDFGVIDRVSVFGAQLGDDGTLRQIGPAQAAQLVRETRRHDAQADLVVYRSDWTRLLQASPAALGDWAERAARATLDLVARPASLPTDPVQPFLLPFWREQPRAFDGITLFFDNMPLGSEAGAAAYTNAFDALLRRLLADLPARAPGARLNIVVPDHAIDDGSGPYGLRRLRDIARARPDARVSFLVLLASPTDDNLKALRSRVESSTSLRGAERVQMLASMVPLLVPNRGAAAEQQFESDLAYAQWNLGGVALWNPAGAAGRLQQRQLDTLFAAQPTPLSSVCALVCTHRFTYRVLMQELVLGAVVLLGWAVLRRRHGHWEPAAATRWHQRLRVLNWTWGLLTLLVGLTLLSCDPLLAPLRQSAAITAVLVGLFNVWLFGMLYLRLRRRPLA